MKKQVFLDFITAYPRQHQPTDYPHCAQRKRGLVQSPGRDNASGQDIGVEEEADPEIGNQS